MAARTVTVRPKMTLDYTLFGATLALVVIGLLMVLDSSFVKTLDSAKTAHDAFFYLKRQAVGAAVGIVALVVMMRVGYWNLRRWAAPLAFCGLVLLAAVWVPHLGVHRNNAARWLRIGIEFQPSELAKLTLIVYIAALLSRADSKVRNLVEGLGPLLLVSGLYLLLIEREPDLGTAFVLFLVMLTQFFLAGARKRHLVLIVVVALSAVLLAGFVFKHRTNRITAFLNRGNDPLGINFQIDNSLYAVGSGQMTGVGLGKGRQKYFLPQANSDFIFATMAEELGFFGTVPILGLLCLVGWRGFRIAQQTRDKFGALLAGGIAAMISWQTLINVAVATATIPATGVPLPFISNGSTSLVLLLACIGLLLNIAQHPTPPGEILRQD